MQSKRNDDNDASNPRKHLPLPQSQLIISRSEPQLRPFPGQQYAVTDVTAYQTASDRIGSKYTPTAGGLTIGRITSVISGSVNAADLGANLEAKQQVPRAGVPEHTHRPANIPIHGPRQPYESPSMRRSISYKAIYMQGSEDLASSMSKRGTTVSPSKKNHGVANVSSLSPSASLRRQDSKSRLPDGSKTIADLEGMPGGTSIFCPEALETPKVTPRLFGSNGEELPAEHNWTPSAQRRSSVSSLLPLEIHENEYNARIEQAALPTSKRWNK